MRGTIRFTLAQIVAIHKANYAYDQKANQIIERLERSLGFNRGAVIGHDNEIIAEYTDHIESLIN